jgi:hypothetical protein
VLAVKSRAEVDLPAQRESHPHRLPHAFLVERLHSSATRHARHALFVGNVRPQLMVLLCPARARVVLRSGWW